VDAAPQELLCMTGEILHSLGQAPGGQLYVGGLPSFRLDPGGLDLEFFPQDTYSDVAVDATTTPPSAVFAATGRLWRVARSGATTTIIEDAALGSLRDLAVDREGRIVVLSGGRGLVRVDPRGGVPVGAGSYEVIATATSVPLPPQV